MLIKHASWVHGNALTLETPNDILVVRRGNGTEMQFHFAPGTTPAGTWCHIAIPTPVMVNDVRLKLHQVFLLFKTGQHAAIDNVHVWDGPRRIHALDMVPGGGSSSVRRTGDHSGSVDGQNMFSLPAQIEVSFGISISFTFRPNGVSTSRAPVDPQGTLLITAAGADFV